MNLQENFKRLEDERYIKQIVKYETKGKRDLEGHLNWWEGQLYKLGDKLDYQGKEDICARIPQINMLIILSPHYK